MVKKVVDKRFAKGKKYKKILTEIENVGVCPFCPENFRWHTNPILKRSQGWLITKNFNPYKNSAHHFLIVGDKHREYLSELKTEDLKNINFLANWAVKKFKIKGGALLMRFGDTLHTGATVCHLHAHLITPAIRKGKATPVWFPIG